MTVCLCAGLEVEEYVYSRFGQVPESSSSLLYHFYGGLFTSNNLAFTSSIGEGVPADRPLHLFDLAYVLLLVMVDHLTLMTAVLSGRSLRL